MVPLDEEETVESGGCDLIVAGETGSIRHLGRIRRNAPDAEDTVHRLDSGIRGALSRRFSADGAEDRLTDLVIARLQEGAEDEAE